MDSQERSGSPNEVHSFTKMPQCTKCAEFQPGYEYVTSVGGLIGDNVIIDWSSRVEALKLTCRRCSYVWLMACASDNDLS